MMKALTSVAILFCSLIALPVDAPPPTVSVTSATTDGSTLTIGGSGFGSGPIIANIESTKANIEAGTVGNDFSKTNWSTFAGGSPNTKPKYTDAKFHTGTKSVKHSYEGDQYTCGYIYHFTANHEIYVSWWAYIDLDTPTESGQWKMFFMTCDGSPSGEGEGEPYLAGGQWYLNDSSIRNAVGGGTGYGTMYWPETGYTALLYTVPSGKTIPRKTWVRVEIYTKDSSVDTANGYYHLRYHIPGTAIHKIRDDSGNTVTITSDATLQNGKNDVSFLTYWGNTVDYCAGIYLDDHYIVRGAGAQSRVEIGDASTWDACTQRHLQIPSAWDTGAITCTYSAGGISGSKYVYVVDVDGAVNSNGFLLGGEAPGSRARVRR